MLKNLKEHREILADLFGLADKDNDKTLYKHKQELEELWTIINKEINTVQDANKKSQAKIWSDQEERTLEEANYHNV